MKRTTGSHNSVIKEVSSYISKSGELELPAKVIVEAKHHILDTLAAMVSGSKLKPGVVAKVFARSQGGIKEAQVAGSHIVTSAINAAFTNAIMAHADETDDSRSGTHPGCGIVPAALAMSEREGTDGMTFLRGVTVGYDIGCRLPLAVGAANIQRLARSTHSIGGNFGAAAAAASVARLNKELVSYVLSYAAQQASGVHFYLRDEEHIQKAFVFAGMPARNGVTSAILVQSGFTGVPDPFTGVDNFFDAFPPDSKPGLLVEELGSRFEIALTTIKRFSVGSPVQAALDAILLLQNKYKFAPKDVKSITAYVQNASVVDNRDMPDLNLQHILAVALLDGDLTFEQIHSYERMNDPAVLNVKKRIAVVQGPAPPAAGIPQRGSTVEIITRDGRQFKEHVVNVRGTVENPMTTAEVEKKCRELLIPVLGNGRSQELIDKIWHLERVENMRELRPLLSAP